MANFIDSTNDAEGHIVLTIKNFWIVRHFHHIEKEVNAITRSCRVGFVVDFANLEGLDTSGAWLLHDLKRIADKRNLACEFVHVASNHQAILDLCERHDKPLVDFDKITLSMRLRGVLDIVRSKVVNFGADVHDILSYVGYFLVSIFQPSQWRNFKFIAFMDHMDRVGFRALPVLVLISFLIGAVFAQQGVFHTRPYGGEVYINLMIAFLVLRELGLIVTAIVVSARSVSAYAAAIGGMYLQEEIDAMKTMGLDPMRILVFPRLLAMVIVLPVLTIVADCVMVGAALITIESYAGIPYEVSLKQIIETVPASSAWFGIMKAPCVGLIMAIIGCYEGSRVFRSSKSLSEHITHAVVKSIFSIIIVDSLFALILSFI